MGTEVASSVWVKNMWDILKTLTIGRKGTFVLRIFEEVIGDSIADVTGYIPVIVGRDSFHQKLKLITIKKFFFKPLILKPQNCKSENTKSHKNLKIIMY